MSEIYHFTDSFFVSLLKKNNLNVKNLLSYSQGELVSKPGKREVRILTLTENDETCKYFLKLAKFEGFKKLFRNIRKKQGLHTSLYKEYQNLNLHKRLNIPVMEIAGFIESFRFGIPVLGVLILKEVKGQEFYKAFLEANNCQKKQLMCSFGKFIAETHNCGIKSIVRVHDIFCTSKDYSNYKNLVLIDREHGELRESEVSRDFAAKQLAKIYLKSLSFLDKMTVKNLAYFLKSYLSHREKENRDWKPYFRAIEKYVDQELVSKEKYKDFQFV